MMELAEKPTRRVPECAPETRRANSLIVVIGLLVILNHSYAGGGAEERGYCIKSDLSSSKNYPPTLSAFP
jgi:hypothetical protein